MPAKKPIKMSDEWTATFRRELTAKTQSIALCYCDKLIGAYQQAEGIEDLRSAHDYVDAAILDTMQGIRTWDPDRANPMPLYRHLCRVIYSRVYHDRHRFKRQRMRSFHELNLDGENSVEVAMSLKRDDERRRPDGAVMLKELHHKGWSWLRTAASQRPGAEDLSTLIDHLAVGITGEPAIRAATGWPEQRYKNACRRFATLVRAMPADLMEAIQDAIVRAPTSTGADWRKPKGTEIGAVKGAKHDDDWEDELFERDPDEDGEPDIEPHAMGIEEREAA